MSIAFWHYANFYASIWSSDTLSASGSQISTSCRYRAFEPGRARIHTSPPSFASHGVLEVVYSTRLVATRPIVSLRTIDMAAARGISSASEIRAMSSSAAELIERLNEPIPAETFWHLAFSKPGFLRILSSRTFVLPPGLRSAAEHTSKPTYVI